MPPQTSTKNNAMEMTMSSVLSASFGARDAAPLTRVVQALSRWWIAYIEWRLERAAIAQLCALTNHQLKDMGLTRSAVAGAVRSAAVRASTG